MKKSKVYTKTGDKGETSLVSGSRLSKSDPRIELYGELDELNSRLGLSITYISNNGKHTSVVEFLQDIQSAIFDLGSNLACEPENRQQFKLPQISDAFIEVIEKQIDHLDHDLEPLKHFILPGGSLAAASLHLCRTGARKMERNIINFQLNTSEILPTNSVIFLNRLSDYFFVLARYMNKHEAVGEIFWKPRT